jgi:HAD superfamily hydrolase (TIGR01509 family)
VLFDYGDTLVTFERPAASLAAAYGRIESLLVEWGFPRVPAKRLLAEVHDRVEEAYAAHQQSGALEEIDLVAVAAGAYRELGIALTAEQLDELLRIEQEAWWEGVTLDPDSIPTLEALRSAGVLVGLCSNAPYRVQSLHDQLRHVGIDHLLDAVVFSGEVRWRKPSPRIFAAALDALGASADRAVMVGDSAAYDVEGAHAAGIRAVLLRRPSNAGASPHHAVATIERLGDLLNVLGV